MLSRKNETSIRPHELKVHHGMLADLAMAFQTSAALQLSAIISTPPHKSAAGCYTYLVAQEIKNNLRMPIFIPK